MAAIFVSYKREDHKFAQRLVKALESRGWDVWWDTRIRAGEVWDEVVERELNAAECVIVLWSHRSILSGNVKDEADLAARRRILVPVLIESVEPPIGHRRVEARDLSKWRGSHVAAEFQDLIRDVARILKQPEPPTPHQDKLLPAYKRALLVYRPRSAKGWVLHLFFYSLILMTILLWVGALALAMYWEAELPIPWYVFGTIVSVVVLAVLQRSATRATPESPTDIVGARSDSGS